MKFKNIKKKEVIHRKPKKEKKENTFFPNIYRTITDFDLFRLRWQKRSFWLQFVSLVALLGFLVISSRIYEYYRLIQEVSLQRQAYMQKLAQWERVNEEYPGFRDGYLQVAMFAYQLKDTGKAKENTKKALNLDPNFIPARRLAAYLGMTEEERIQN